MVSEFALVTSWQLICSSNRTKENMVLMVCWRVHDQSDSQSSEVQRKTNQHWWTDRHDILHKSLWNISQKYIAKKPERSKKFIYIFTIFLYPLPSQMVGGKLDRLCGLKRPESGVFQIANSDKDDSRADDHAVCLTCSEECCRASAGDHHHSHSHCLLVELSAKVQEDITVSGEGPSPCQKHLLLSSRRARRRRPCRILIMS